MIVYSNTTRTLEHDSVQYHTRKLEHDSVQCYYQKIRTLQRTVQQTENWNKIVYSITTRKLNMIVYSTTIRTLELDSVQY